MNRLSDEYDGFEKEYEFAKALRYLTIKLSEEISKEFKTTTRIKEASKLFKWMENEFIELSSNNSELDVFISMYYSDINDTSLVEDYLDSKGFSDDYDQFNKNLGDHMLYQEINSVWFNILHELLFSGSKSVKIYTFSLVTKLFDRYDIDEYISKLERSL